MTFLRVWLVGWTAYSLILPSHLLQDHYMFALSRQMGGRSLLNSWTQNWQHSSCIPWARICHMDPRMCGVAGTYRPWPPTWLPSDIWVAVSPYLITCFSVSRSPSLGNNSIFPDPEVSFIPPLPSSTAICPRRASIPLYKTKILSLFSTPQILFVDSVRANFNVFSFYSLLSRASSFSLSVLLGTIRIPKVGPKPCNIVRKWLAGRPPRGLPKWHYLNEFFTVHGLARRLTDPKIQSY